MRQLLSWNLLQGQLGPRWAPLGPEQNLTLESLRGSFSRWRDYDANFLPHRRLEFSTEGWPWAPIEVVCVDQVGFVVDGHHRVALAARLGWTQLAARVRRIETVCPLLPGMSGSQLLAQAGLDRWWREQHLGPRLASEHMQLRSLVELRLIEQRRSLYASAEQWWQVDFEERGVLSLGDYLRLHFPSLEKRRSWWSRFRGRRVRRDILGWV
jgi:hypothetical protein